MLTRIIRSAARKEGITDEHEVWNARGIRHAGGPDARCGENPRCGLPALGRVLAFPYPRDEPGHGLEEFKGWLVRIHWRRDRLHHRHDHDLVDERARLSD